ncbi:MAG: exodeoxyribonuclease VII large subunit [Zoogloeaceae bacterium]|jgi:exodeoxyribonuclease VII large subunit|nr:exodeoxyribonuclease VII large subunit [Zoogloeaceae bacterium]
MSSTFPSVTFAEAILSVGELNRAVRGELETRFPLLWVSGEISSLTHAASGHLYFTLKDANAQVRCTIWRTRAQLLGFRPENGQKVEARALVTLYEARGDYQLNVETLRLAGQGGLFERFLELKAKLETEGLFRAELKRPLPAFVRRIAIVTSPQASALQDVLATLARRAPQVALTIFSTPVQGEGAGRRIALALAAASASDSDAILLCRGGGSMEDLWAFNEEVVVRAIRAARLPVVSGVGHETDFTIADFVADLRAPTPTAAAEQICPDRQTWLDRLSGLCRRIDLNQGNRLAQLSQHLDHLAARLPSPARQLAIRRARLAMLVERLRRVGDHGLGRARVVLQQCLLRLDRQCPDLAAHLETVDRLAQRLQHAATHAAALRRSRLASAAQGLRQLDPLAVLARGYAIAFDADGKAVRDAAGLQPEDALRLALANGDVQTKVVSVISNS